MTVLLIVKLLCDFSYYFLFAHYIGSFSGVSYSLPLTLAALVAAGTLSGLLEKRGKLRLLPAVAAFALLLQVRALPDAIVLLPPLLYLWTLCYKGLYWPDGDEYKDVFSIQWKLLLVLPLLLLLTLDLDAMQRNCLPLLVLFLATAVLSLRMMRHSPAVLSLPRFQVQNALTVAAVGLAAWALSSDAFFAAVGGVFAGIRWLLAPIAELVVWGLANGVGLLMKAAVYLINLIRHALGTNLKEQPEIKIPENLKDDQALEQQVPPNSETFARVLTALAVITALITAYILFKKMLGRRRPKGNGSGFVPGSMADPEEKRRRDPLLAPREPRAAVRWHYRKFLKYCQSKNLPISRFHNSRQINNLANKEKVARLADTDPLRELYLGARYSDHPVTEADARQAKELVKRIKEEQKS
jgi:hypothetical protein